MKTKKMNAFKNLKGIKVLTKKQKQFVQGGVNWGLAITVITEQNKDESSDGD